MDFTFSEADEVFRSQSRKWLAEHVKGNFAGRSTNDLQRDWTVHAAWERVLGEHGWIGMSWPKEYGGRDASLTQQMIFNEEYVRAEAPVRAGFFGEALMGPTLIELGTQEQKRRLLPPILRGEEFWCQGFSEPEAGSDLANVKTRAVLDGDEWIISGQKVWTSQANAADWCFLLCRTNAEAPKHRGISFLLCPMNQPGVEVRPIRQITGTAEFNEVFFNEARTPAENIVGNIDGGWRVAMATLGFERGTAFLAQQLRFASEYGRLFDAFKARGATTAPLLRDRLARAYIELQIMRYSGFRTVTTLLKGGTPGPEASVGKLFWSQWHQRLGELEMDVLGAPSQIVGDSYDLNDFQQTFLFSRAHTIYAGSSEVQRNVVGERVLGLPKEPDLA